LIKIANKVVKPAETDEEVATTITKDQELLMEIRDLLRNRSSGL